MPPASSLTVNAGITVLLTDTISLGCFAMKLMPVHAIGCIWNAYQTLVC
jgi:hypothetical protein